MEPLTIALVIPLAAVTGGGVVWAVMTIGQLRRQVEQLAATVGQLSDERRQAEKDAAMALTARDQALTALRTENDELRRTAWPGNLTLDQRAWAANLTNLQEIAVQDSLDVLQRLNPEAARRVIGKFAPHLLKKGKLK